MNARWSMVCAALLLAACSGGEESAPPPAAADPQVPPAVTGTVTYRERMLLPPSAQLEISLQDVSRADAPATTLAMQRIDNPGSPPFEFRLEYDPAAIDPRNTYAVRAIIRDAGRLMFTTDTVHRVLTRDAGNTVDMLLKRVVTLPLSPPLLGTRWGLITVEGRPVVSRPPPNDAHLQLLAEGGTASGNSGCNRFSGSFETDGARLSFGQMISTRMACADPATMQLETSFLAAMAKVDGFEIDQRELRLKSGDAVLLAFAPTEAPDE